MRTRRAITAISLIALCALSFAEDKVAVGKLGEATEPTAVYVSASRKARVLYSVAPGDRLVVKKSSNPNWDLVLLRDYRYAYAPAAAFTVLPYTAYMPKRRVSEVLSSRSRIPNRTGDPVADAALMFQGTPYKWGGNDLANGIDCSGFVKKLEGAIGNLDLPRTAAEQAHVGTPIYRMEELQPGDRLYFKMKSESRISHTGIYLGNGQFIHSSHGKGGVSTDYLTAGWRKMLVAARR